MKLSLSIALIMPVFLLAASCSRDSDTPAGPMSVDKAVLVYMASNNNLSSYSVEDFDDMLGGYLPQWFDSGSGDVLLVYLHQLHATPNLMRLYSRDGVACIDTLVRYPQQNSCADTVFHRVLEDAFGSFPSSERGLILSSHGTGWLPEGYYNDPVASSDAGLCPSAPCLDGSCLSSGGASRRSHEVDPYCRMVKSFGIDGTDDSEMEIYELRDAIDTKMDFILFDCCLMGGVEVAYEFRSVADYIIFSQTEILADGFPYEGVMNIVFRKDADVSCRTMDVARLYFDYYDAKTSTESRSATISVVKSSELESLACAVRNIMDAGGKSNTDTLALDGSVLKSVQRYFRYDYHWFYDLDDYMCHVCPDGALYDAFSDALDKAVIYKAATPAFLSAYGGFSITHFSGLSTYVDAPLNKYLEKHYGLLDWGAACSLQSSATMNTSSESR